MKSIRNLFAIVALLSALGLSMPVPVMAAGPEASQQDSASANSNAGGGFHEPRYGYGPGGYGWGPGMMYGYGGYGMGPGAMGAYGMGPGMMYGYGPGGYGHGGYGMGPGMMYGYGGGYGMGPGMMGGYGMGPGMMYGWGGPGGFFGHGLELTDAQQAKINKITDETRKSQWAVMGAMMDQQVQLRDLYGASKPDEAAIDKAYKNLNQLRQQMFDNMVDAQKRIDAVLTKEQREKLRNYWRGGW